ncbi:4Fe-4S binding protein [Pseudoruegeria sp. HB172150]|uniref:4Fe-4S binding protein n=1 Tax=Pseudoruegeria sp. HB172150 TaxID=2721164 RepID=UPI0015570216|nr:4Fe-4S binding protein [Pseudoruegeria sp. HB172150]
MVKRLILCDCEGLQQIDSAGLAEATGLDVSPVCTALCTKEIGRAAEAISAGNAVVCCGQEQRIFEALSEEIGAEVPRFLDLRDRAGWTEDTRPTLPKMAALAAEAMLPAPAAKSVDVVSEGLCLVLGAEDVALAAAEKLKGYLGVTVLLDEVSEVPDTREFDVIAGRLRSATGALGGFRVVIDGLRQVEPGGRGGFSFGPARDGGVSECDIILDLRGGAPLFPAPEKREGYLKADPGRPEAVADAVLEASHLVGTFEKPLYVKTEPLLCAHSRAGQTGCTRCLDLCPTGAISPDGDHVSVDPMICAGCGACSAVCPSGAISYDAPPVDLVMRRVQTLAKGYLDAGGEAPRLLVVGDWGAEMIRLTARYGRGLPADVVPLEVDAVNAFGHAEILAGLAAGFAEVTVVPSPGTDRDALALEVGLAVAIGGEAAVRVIDTNDPDAMSDALYGVEVPAPIAAPVRPMGSRRQIARSAARALQPEAEVFALPEGAPYGAVLVNTDACTLCLSCVSLCPSGALGDNPDLPQLRFQEDACLQCGICETICPENAIGYEPRLNLTDSALEQVVLHEEEPFCCIECGKPFGVTSTVERILEKLAGKHGMFRNEQAARMIQMCDDCRVNAQYHMENSPFRMGDRPRVRTTDDYLSKRRDH